LWWLSCGFEADGLDECIKVIDDAVIEAVELGSLFIPDSSIGADGAEKACGHTPTMVADIKEIKRECARGADDCLIS
jgi:hypothetical protein